MGASVPAIVSPGKKEGSAGGTRSRKISWAFDALHMRKKSTRFRSVDMRPWVVLTTIGKKQIRNVITVRLLSPGPPPRKPSVPASGRSWLQALDRAQDPRDLGDELLEGGGLAGLLRPGIGKVHRDLGVDPSRICRHDEDPVRQENRLRHRVRDEEGRPGELLADAQELLVQVVARHLVKSAKRLVGEQMPRRDA